MNGPGERGSTAPLIIAFTAIILLLVAVVVDASAAYLTRQRLAELADGAALQGADRGAQGSEAYVGGLDEERLTISRAEAEAAVLRYLHDAGALEDHPGLQAVVSVGAGRVDVDLIAPLDLPLSLPGGPAETTVRASGSAVVDPQE